MTERLKATTRERGREVCENVNYEPIACELYPIAASTYERRGFFGALRASHPARVKPYRRCASHNLVFAVIIAAAVVLFVVVECSRATQHYYWNSSAGTSDEHPLYSVDGSLFADR